MNFIIRLKNIRQEENAKMTESKNININSLWIFILFVIIVFFNFSCAGPAEEKQEKNETTKIKMPLPSQTKLAPGTLKVKSSVIKMIKKNNHYNCIIRVEKILGYGMAAKPVAKGSEINLNLTNSGEDLIKLLSEGTMDQKYELIIEQEQMVDNQLEWRALQVKKIQFEQ